MHKGFVPQFTIWRPRGESNPCIRVLQTLALPLGYSAIGLQIVKTGSRQLFLNVNGAGQTLARTLPRPSLSRGGDLVTWPSLDRSEQHTAWPPAQLGQNINYCLLNNITWPENIRNLGTTQALTEMIYLAVNVKSGVAEHLLVPARQALIR